MNFIERMENLKMNIEIFGLGMGLVNAGMDNIVDNADLWQKRVNRTCDWFERILDDPSELFKYHFNVDYANRPLQYGDVIVAEKWFVFPLQHFGIYIGNSRVIHFAMEPYSLDVTVHDAPFSEFLGDSGSYRIIEFRERRNTISRYPSEQYKDEHYHLYSPEETVARAWQVVEAYKTENGLQRLFNNHVYNLLSNNCEHFAIWCKTGISESKQIDRLFKGNV